MGYTTEFEGEFSITPALRPEHAAYLRALAGTRRMRRDPALLAGRPDPVREAAGLPVGAEGQYYVGSTASFGQDHTPDVVEYNDPPVGQPGLWLQWEPDETGEHLRWNGAEKFYHYAEWLQYLIANFLKPWGYSLRGRVRWTGEDSRDTGTITALGHEIDVMAGGSALDELIAIAREGFSTPWVGVNCEDKLARIAELAAVIKAEDD